MASNETTVSTRTDIQVTVADDRMTAWIALVGESPESPLEASQVEAAVESAKVVLNEDVARQIEQFVRRSAAGAPMDQPFVLAEGVPPAEAKAECFQWDDSFKEEIQEWQEDEPADFYSSNSILTVDSGVVIGVIKTEPGIGCDVLGNELRPAGKMTPLDVCSRTLEREGDTLRTLIAGRIIERNHRIKIDEVLKINDDVSFETGNIDSKINVAISGRIPDRFEVRSGRSIIVGMAIEAAEVHAKEHVITQRGIIGRASGLVTAGGDVTTKYTTDAHLVVKGDLKVGKQMVNTNACVAGSVDAPRSSVQGGCLIVRGVVDVANLGAQAQPSTKIVVDVNALALREVAVINQQIKQGIVKLSDVREKRKKLLADVALNGDPKIIVHGTIFPKVTLRLGDRHVEFKKQLKGPLAVERRKIDGVTQIVAVNQLTGSITTLKSQRRDPDDLLDGFELPTAE